jgi:hypothetical protein
MRIDQALFDMNLLGAALGPIDTWQSWLTILKAANGLPLDASEQAFFHAVCGGRAPPQKPVRELWVAVGRQAGKSRTAGALAAYIGALCEHRLVAGETGVVLVLAATRGQAAVVFNYALGFLESSPLLRQQIESVTAEEIRLAGNIVIAVHASNYRSVRGRTLLACIFDEIAFWPADEFSSNPDREVYRAVMPSLARSRGPLIAISSPYRRAGMLHERHKSFFGVDDSHVLFVQAATSAFNSTIDKAIIDQAAKDDPESARSEWQGEFRADLAGFLEDRLIDQALDCDRPLELPPRRGAEYFGFVDASGGGPDAYALAIAHMEKDRVIVDLVRGRVGCNPQTVTGEYTDLCHGYGITSATGDAYGAAWVEDAWRSRNIRYERSQLTASAIYLESLPLFSRGAIALPDHVQLARELRNLERRTGRTGKDNVSHPGGLHDDHANAACGAAVLAAKAGAKGPGCFVSVIRGAF